MELLVKKGITTDNKADLLVLFWFADAKKQHSSVTAIDKQLGGLLSKIAAEEEFQGKSGQTIYFRTLGKISAAAVLVIGLGSKKEFNFEVARRVAAISIKKAREVGARTIISSLPGELSPRETALAMTEGALLANYRFIKFRKEDLEHESKKGIVSLTIVESESSRVQAAELGIQEGKLRAAGTIEARELVNEPAMHMTPAMLVKKAQQLVDASSGKIKMKVFDKTELKKMGAGGILSVAMGSDHPPILVHLIWKPARAKRSVALVGKAITFDSGGLSLKPSDSMTTMKCDMAGAAAVLGLFSIITRLKPKVEVHGIFAACENMPSGTAMRPGDIVTTMSGKTIEILNTDAEGRVTLADSLCYATQQKPDVIIDLATLTGACVVALGEEVAGLMTNNSRLGAELRIAADRAGEYLWELPLVKEYRELIVSKIADVKNIGGRWGGALTAGLFLKEFVNNDQSWAHLDIAGPAFAEHEVIPYVPLGGSGYGVRTLVEFLKLVK